MGSGAPGLLLVTGEGVSAGNPRAAASLQEVDRVSPRQAVACGCPGAGVHPLVCEAGLEAGSGCSWTGPGPRRVWVWSLPAGGWTWAPGSTDAGPCVPIQRLCWCEGLAVWGPSWAQRLIRQPVCWGGVQVHVPACLVAGPEASHAVCVAGGQVSQVLG